jgi:hypothetical protein
MSDKVRIEADGCGCGCSLILLALFAGVAWRVFRWAAGL